MGIKKAELVIEWDEGDVPEWEQRVSPLVVTALRESDRSFYFERAAEFSSPKLTMRFLSALSVRFGTTDIDVIGDINQPGCDTCDSGSLYGHTIYVRNITRNNPFSKGE